MVAPPAMVPPPVMVPPPAMVPLPAVSQRQLDKDKLKTQELAIKKMQAVVNGHEKAMALEQKTTKKPVSSPGKDMGIGSALLNILSFAKTAGKPPTPSSDKKMDSKAAASSKGQPKPVPIPLQSKGPLVDYTHTTTEGN